MSKINENNTLEINSYQSDENSDDFQTNTKQNNKSAPNLNLKSKTKKKNNLNETWNDISNKINKNKVTFDIDARV